jgi:hypothetical protein
MAKKFDPKAKAKRQKIMAIGGAVILLGLLAIQVPRTMKMLNASAPAAQREAAPPAGTTPADPSVLPTPGTAVPGTPVSGGGGGSLIDSDIPPAPETGQLVSFGRFASKDPFAEQIDDGGSSGGGSASGGTGSADDGGIVGSDGGGGGGSEPAASGSATIAVNGTEEAVSVKGQFPASAPVFVLVSVSRGEAKIAIAGGAFASGAPTITLRLGKAITLVNTADGVRYELKLVKTG